MFIGTTYFKEQLAEKKAESEISIPVDISSNSEDTIVIEPADLSMWQNSRNGKRATKRAEDKLARI